MMQVGYNDSWKLELSASRDYQETHQCHQKPKSDKVLGELEAEARSGKGKKKKLRRLAHSGNSRITGSGSALCTSPRSRPFHVLEVSHDLQRCGNHRSRFWVGLNTHPSSVTS